MEENNAGKVLTLDRNDFLLCFFVAFLVYVTWPPEVVIAFWEGLTGK